MHAQFLLFCIALEARLTTPSFLKTSPDPYFCRKHGVPHPGSNHTMPGMTRTPFSPIGLIHNSFHVRDAEERRYSSCIIWRILEQEMQNERTSDVGRRTPPGNALASLAHNCNLYYS
ncbi:hypothetical protein BDZ97DRAFT_624993 [Flammula alnicola]|nr:hypothetical protein BDZ97DRAFT_624993 [Flammula alnicola]